MLTLCNASHVYFSEASNNKKISQHNNKQDKIFAQMLYKENAVGYKAYIILYLHMLSKTKD